MFEGASLKQGVESFGREGVEEGELDVGHSSAVDSSSMHRHVSMKLVGRVDIVCHRRA